MESRELIQADTFLPIKRLREKVEKWMNETTDKLKSLDGRLVMQITMFAITIGTFLVQGGRILEKQDQSESRVISLINTNEVKRDLKDAIKENDLTATKARLEQEILDRKETDKRLDKIRELFLVKFGQPIEKP